MVDFDLVFGFGEAGIGDPFLIPDVNDDGEEIALSEPFIGQGFGLGE